MRTHGVTSQKIVILISERLVAYFSIGGLSLSEIFIGAKLTDEFFFFKNRVFIYTYGSHALIITEIPLGTTKNF
jgi:hypothetical protein